MNIYINSLMASGNFAAIVGSENSSNFNYVIIGLIVVIIVLVGVTMFAPKK